MQTVLEILGKTEKFFAEKGVPTPKLDAQLILAHALKCKRLELFLRFDEPLPEASLEVIRTLVRRRAKREPLQHILGFQDFFDVKIKCDARALIPRQETEELCDILTTRYFPDTSANVDILDLGTGSGAIAIALSKYFENAKVSAVDKSEAALSLAIENAEFNQAKVSMFISDWFSCVEGKFDLIVANPPYLTSDEVASAGPEVKDYDPISALVADDAGMADLKVIIKSAHKYLKENGILACECGLEQPEKLVSYALESGFTSAEVLQDASKRDRFLICK